MSALRGMGGTGVGLVHKEFDTDLAKSHIPAPNFVCSDEWDWVGKNLFSSRAVLGHTRSATIGTVSTKNAHPFRFTNAAGDSVLMIHNGHIRNYLTLTPPGFTHPVDSAHAAHALLEKGALATLESIEGAYVLIWYDTRTKMLNMARNVERELYYALNKEQTILYFASEMDMLVSLLRRNNIPHVNEFWQLDTLTLYQWDLTKKVLKAMKTKYEEKKFLPAASYQNENGGLYGNSQQRWKDYTKQFPGKGDCIWVSVPGDAKSAVNLYKPIGTGENETLEQHAYGFAYGTRSMEKGSKVRIVGLHWKDWNEKTHLIAHSLPCRIINLTRDEIDPDTGQKYAFYEVRLEEADAAKEIQDQKRRLAEKDKYLKRPNGHSYVCACESCKTLDRGSLPLVTHSSSTTSSVGKTEGGGSSVGVGPNNGTPVGSGAERRGGDNLRVERALTDLVPGPAGQKITYREWREVASKGCVGCKGMITAEDIGRVEWWEFPLPPEDHNPLDAEYQMICECCVHDPIVMKKVGT